MSSRAVERIKHSVLFAFVAVNTLQLICKKNLTNKFHCNCLFSFDFGFIVMCIINF